MGISSSCLYVGITGSNSTVYGRAKKHGLTPVELSLGFARDRPFMTSSIVGATSVDQLKEDIDAFLTVERPLPPEVMADIESVFNRYKDPAIL